MNKAIEEVEQESSDDKIEDKESSNDKETDMDDDDYSGFAFFTRFTMFHARQSGNTKFGYDLIANLQWMCSLIQGYWIAYMMQSKF